MTFYLLTSNPDKYQEYLTSIPDLQQLDLELDEIQTLDSQTLIEHKLNQSATLHDGAFIVEDVSLSITGMNGLPGPYIKHFLKTIGLEGIVKLANTFGSEATLTCTIGYRDRAGDNHYFVGELPGHIVPPAGEGGWGFDPIFQPEGYDLTFSQLGPDQKQQISHRAKAIGKLKAFLSTTSLRGGTTKQSR